MAREQGTSLWDTARAGVVRGKAGASLAQFVALIESLRVASSGLTLPEAVSDAIERSGLKAHYHAEKDGQDRLDNLEELVNAADSFLREADLAVDAPIALGDAADAAAQGAVDPLTAFLAHAFARPR